MKVASENLREKMRSKADEELYDILHVHRQDYIPEAVEAAREEFNCRQLDAPAIADVAASAERALEREEAPLSWPLKSLAFFVSTIFLCIPVLLAHRHFVEKGERRKAREWAKWGLYGFFFYLGLGIISRWFLASAGH